ncbi:MAG: short-chain fatty acyl-CoA regulator family protein [Brevundimonas sp.]
MPFFFVRVDRAGNISKLQSARVPNQLLISARTRAA